MTVHKGKAGGTVHYVRKAPTALKPVPKSACLVSHKNMSWTDTFSETSCPQCVLSVREARR